MRVLMSVLVALLGAVVGAAIGVAITYELLSDAGVDALVWAVTGVFFCVPLMLGGAVATGLLGRRLVPGVFRSGRPGTVRQGRYGFGSSVMYGIGAYFAIRNAIQAFTDCSPDFDAPFTPEKVLMALYRGG